MGNFLGCKSQRNIAAAHRVLGINRRGFEFPNATVPERLFVLPNRRGWHGQLNQGDDEKNNHAQSFHAAARFLNRMTLATRNPTPTTMNPTPRVQKLRSLSKKRLTASAAMRSKPKFARAMLFARMPRARMSIPRKSA